MSQKWAPESDRQKKFVSGQHFPKLKMWLFPAYWNNRFSGRAISWGIKSLQDVEVHGLLVFGPDLTGSALGNPPLPRTVRS